jgi:hypothetical protein
MAKNNKSAVVADTNTTENTIQEQTSDVVVVDTIKEQANKLMQEQGVEVVYATEDGNLFLPQNKQHAIEHAHKTQQELLTINKQ